jgi:hypothetical protein
VFGDRQPAPSWVFPVPLVDLAHAEAFLAHHAAEDERRRRARAAPTLANKLLDWVEGHFIEAMLLFFFVLLPGVSVGIAWLVGD